MADLAPDGLRRHAELPAHPAREGRRDRHRPAVADARPALGGEAFPARRARLARRRAASPPTRATARPTSASSPTRPSAREGLVVDEGVIVEIVRPGTGDPVRRRRGRRGRRDDAQPRLPADPLRHRRPVGGAAGACPTGRTNQRIRGWLGRADQTTKVRGMFVHPSQVAEIVRRHPEVARGAAGRRGRDGRRPHDAAGRGRRGAPRAWPSASRETIRDVTKLRGDVELVAAGQPAQRRQGDRGPAIPVAERRSAARMSGVPRWRRRSAAGTMRAIDH